ncbi:MAG: polymer-forming cytoskeletal protein, partial [Candidatus Subteraquimicrobiales bacterium]|nr:polymer-forming cytoskeletal protein [Candidatus Subteraquimicrobiales bacterium]
MEARKMLALIPLTVLILFFSIFNLAYADEGSKDIVRFGENVIVEEDEVIEGSIVIFGGDATIAGEVEKDVVVFGGDIDLKSTAVIHRDLVSFGGKVTREEGAKVLGSEVTNISRLRNLKIKRAPLMPFTVTGRSWLDNFLSLLGNLALVLIIVALLPKYTQVAAEAIGKNPWGTLGVGILVALALFP